MKREKKARRLGPLIWTTDAHLRLGRSVLQDGSIVSHVVAISIMAPSDGGPKMLYLAFGPFSFSACWIKCNGR